MEFHKDGIYGSFQFSILNNDIFSVDYNQTSIPIPPVINDFNLLEQSQFLLLDGTDFKLL